MFNFLNGNENQAKLNGGRSQEDVTEDIVMSTSEALTDQHLRNKTVPQLKQMCKELGLSNYSVCTKQELINKIIVQY